MATGYELKQVDPSDVALNQNNPRGESADTISRDPAFQQLKDSVFQFGVLVPIVVHKQEGTGGKPYRLVDGERRLRAAIETRQKKIPAHIAPARDPTADLTQAFHIHMLRKQWRNVAQTRAMKQILGTLQESVPRKEEQDLVEELLAKTGCTETRLKTLRRAAEYPEKVLREVDAGELAFSHLVQFEESFVEQLAQHYPALLRKLGRDRVREVLLAKARGRILTDTRSLMGNIIPVISRAKTPEQKAAAESLLRKFIDDEDMSAEDVLVKFERQFPQAGGDVLASANQAIEKSEALMLLLNNLRAPELKGFPKAAKNLRKNLDALRRVVGVKLRSLNAVVGTQV